MSLYSKLKDHGELFMSAAALITAVAAVFIAMEQTKVMRAEAELDRQHARISVLPSIWLSTHITDSADEAFLKVVLTNRGLGPGVIERFDVWFDEQPVNNWDALMRAIEAAEIAAGNSPEKSFTKTTLGSFRAPLSPGLMLEASASATPLHVSMDTDADGLRMLFRGLEQIKMQLCYCSLYGDCYQSQLFQRPQPVAKCEADPNPFFSHGFFPTASN